MPLSVAKLRREASRLKKAFAAGETPARQRVAARLGSKEALQHADFLHVVAVENHFQIWPHLVAAAEVDALDRVAAQGRMRQALYFGQALVVERLLAAWPDLPDRDFGIACALYDVDRVAAQIAADPAIATRAIGPRRPILHLAFSRWIKQRPDTEGAMLATAQALVDAGADPSDGYPQEPGSDHLLSALYGAVGHADNMALARWLLEHGADPNDNESLYHATELSHHDALRMLLAHGADPTGTNALLRAMDFNDHAAVTMLLEAGAQVDDFNQAPVGGEAPTVIPALHQAARRGCDAAMVTLLLQAGAAPDALWHGVTAYALARVYGHDAVADTLAAAGARSTLTSEEAAMATAAQGQSPQRTLDENALPEAYRGLLRNIVSIPGRRAHVAALIGAGFGFDAPDTDGITPVQIAGWEGLPDHMADLLALGPDLGHINVYGGDLLTTILHGSENAPARAERDHIACLRLALDAGVALPRREIGYALREDVVTFLEAWADAHPDRVV